MSVVHAAIFREDGLVRSIITAQVKALNNDIGVGETWREIPIDVENSSDVPPLNTLPKHPDLIEVAG